MKYLFDALEEIKERMQGKDLMVLSDFDGTLSPIVPHPGSAQIDKEIRKSLIAITRIPGISVGIISGRMLSDTKARVDIPGIFYSGVHGWVWEAGGVRHSFEEDPDAERLLKIIARDLSGLIDIYPGIVIENKKVSVAVHYRMANDTLGARIRKLVHAAILVHDRKRQLVTEAGKKVLEIIPSGHPTKWDSVRAFTKFYEHSSGRRATVMYMGDDETDENIFENLKHGITIRVRQSSHSHAGYYVHSISEVRTFTAWLADMLSHGSGTSTGSHHP